MYLVISKNKRKKSNETPIDLKKQTQKQKLKAESKDENLPHLKSIIMNL